jgi:hypothetical protein
MGEYNPDHWVIIKIDSEKYGVVYKVLAGWYGGYLGSDSWRMNSGITQCIEEGNYWLFIGSSGSTYVCHKDTYGLSMKTTGGIWNQLEAKYGDKVELMETDGIDWSLFEWESSDK